MESEATVKNISGIQNNSADNKASPDYLVPIPQVCKELSVGSTTLWRLSRNGELPPKISIGHRVGYSRRALDRWKAEKGFVVDGFEAIASSDQGAAA